MTAAGLDIAVRLAVPGDLAAVDALFARAYPRLLKADYPPSLQVMALPRLARAQPQLLASGRYFVAEWEGRIVGAGGYSMRAGGTFAHVRHVVTDDRLTRRGIGRALLGRVFLEARAAGCGGLHCLATRSAEPFYAALGFRRIRATSVALAPGIDFPVIEMQRGL